MTLRFATQRFPRFLLLKIVSLPQSMVPVFAVRFLLRLRGDVGHLLMAVGAQATAVADQSIEQVLFFQFSGGGVGGVLVDRRRFGAWPRRRRRRRQQQQQQQQQQQE